MDYKNKNVLVCGMARSGISAAELLISLGANVTLQDLKTREYLGDITYLENKGIKIYSGKNPDEIIKNQDLIIVSPGIPCDLPFFEIAKNDNIPVWSEVELAYTITPCPIVAITGTNGKTTTTAMVGEIMALKYTNAAVVGNIGVPYSEKVNQLTVSDYVIAEISSFQLETSHKFHPHISAVLNITPDHLNRHKTLENYISIKEKIFTNQNENDFCILNYDDIECRSMADKTKSKVLFFSSKESLQIGIYLEKDNIIVKWGDINKVIINVNDLKVLGIHNYENAMAAIGIALCAGVPLDNISKALVNFNAVEHRIEFVETIDNVDYYNDSKGTNPDASIRAVEAMKKPIILIGGGLNKGSEFDDWVKTFKGRVKHLILIGETAEKIKHTAEKYGFTDTTIIGTFEDAIEKAKNIAISGDCVLLSPACASWDMFESYEQRGDIFKEKVRGFKSI